jgi:hypothetical protein
VRGARGARSALGARPARAAPRASRTSTATPSSTTRTGGTTLPALRKPSRCRHQGRVVHGDPSAHAARTHTPPRRDVVERSAHQLMNDMPGD